MMEEKDVTLRDYIRVVKKRKKVILLVFGVAVATSAVVSFILPPIYQVKLTLKIGKIVDIDTLEKRPIESVTAACRVLQGPQLLGEAVRDLKLPLTLEQLRRRIFVEPIQGTDDLLELKVEAKNPVRTLKIANFLASKLINRHQQMKTFYEDVGKILSQYDQQIFDINKELTQIEENKRKILLRYNANILNIRQDLHKIDEYEGKILAKYDENISRVNKEMAKIASEISETRKEMKNLQVAAQNLSRNIENIMKESKSLSTAESELLVGQMTDLRNQLAAYRAEIKSDEQRYYALAAELRQIEIEKANLQGGKSQIYYTLMGELRKTEIEKTEFERNESQRYYTLMTEFRNAEMLKTKLQRRSLSGIYPTEVLVSPEKPKAPERPNKPLNILIVAVVSLVVGLGVAFSLEYFEKPVK